MLQLFHLFLEQHVSGRQAQPKRLQPVAPPEGRDRPRVLQSSSVDAEDQNKKNFCILFQSDFKSDTIRANFLLYTNY